MSDEAMSGRPVERFGNATTTVGAHNEQLGIDRTCCQRMRSVHAKPHENSLTIHPTALPITQTGRDPLSAWVICQRCTTLDRQTTKDPRADTAVRTHSGL